MTPEQEHTFRVAASSGIACGLTHRYEWLMNELKFLVNFVHESAISFEEHRLITAFLEFEKTTASCGEEFDELAGLTTETFMQKVHNWYKDHPNAPNARG